MAQSVLPRREQHWLAALAIAILLHLVILYLGFAAPPLHVPLRGGGLFAEGGESAHSTGGIMVDLSPPVAPPAPAAQPVPEPAAPEAETAAVTEPAADAEPEADEPEPADQTDDAEVEAPAEPEAMAMAMLAREAAAAKPQLKPALPPRRVRLAQERPQPTPSAQPTVPKQDALPNALNVQPSRLGTAGGRTDGVVPTELSYRDQVLLWLKRHIYYPTEAYQFRQEGTVVVRFAINRRGQILFYNIDKSSGYYLLDQAVRIMMSQSSPVPPFPAGQGGEEMRFLVPVIFDRDVSG